MFGRDKFSAHGSQVNTANNAVVNTTAATSKIETTIGPNSRMNGTLQSDGGIRIEGIFEGVLQTTSSLVIAETAKVIAEIQAYNVVISGQVKGNITANKIEITETGKVWGDLNVNTLLLHEGAYLRGNTNMAGDVEPPEFEPPRIAPPRPIAEISAAESADSELTS